METTAWVIEHDPNSGVVLSKTEFGTVDRAVGSASEGNRLEMSVGYSPRYSVWVFSGAFWYLVDMDSERMRDEMIVGVERI